MKEFKFYRNPSRKETVNGPKPYRPVYQEMGLEPAEMSAASIPSKAIITADNVGAQVNPRVRPVPSVRTELPISEVTTPPFTGQIPNVGMERSWVTLDGEDFYFDGDEIVSGLDPDHPIIDNNIDDPNNYQDIPLILKQAPAPVDSSEEVAEDTPLQFKQEASFDIEEDEYVVVVHGQIVSSGHLSVVESDVKKLVFGEHELNSVSDINTDDIIVLKRVKIKVGVFIE